MESVYQPLIRTAIESYDDEEMVLALDTSQVWGRFVIIRISLIYRGRGIPIVWEILASESASVGF